MLELNKFKLNTTTSTTRNNLQIEKISTHDIAIIGMAIDFPDSKTPEEFWEHLRLGRDLIRPFPKERRKDTDPYLQIKGYSAQEMEYSEGGYLDKIDKFDPLFFKISPIEASLMDPNQRIFLQTAWHALEDAGYGGEKLKGSNTGVFLGFSSDFGHEYKDMVFELEPEKIPLSISGNIKSIIASRISYILDFKGPSLAVDTACSSSLTAIHLACRALRSGECDQALAGSVKIKFIPLKSREGDVGIRSSNDRARTFDDSSDGTGSGEGCGVILLKPLNRAIEEGDRILAVIKGSGMNQDGSSIGITAPNSLAQAEVLDKAWKDAGIHPETISYIEAHGTGTRLGDPIEIDGIKRAFERYTQKKQFCGISSVKTNTGHLDHAAGMVSIVKAILALQHQELPPTVHFEQPNREIDFQNSPVYVVERLTPWHVENGLRRCGISAFGLSGTNCHLVLEEAPKEQTLYEVTSSSEVYLLTISAAKKNSLLKLVNEYHSYFKKQNSSTDLQAICYTANTGRGHYSYRLILQFKTYSQLMDQLTQLDSFTVEDLENFSIFGVLFGDHTQLADEKAEHLTQLANVILDELKEETNPITGELQKLHLSDQQAGELAKLYTTGAAIDWETLYQGQNLQKVQLPTYTFESRRCWVEITDRHMQKTTQQFIHPLLDEVYEEMASEKVYRSLFSAKLQWELKDHLISGYHVLPGTAYLELARGASLDIYPEGMEIRDLIFLNPLALTGDEEREVHTIVRKTEGGYHEFNVVSQDLSNSSWFTHVDAKIFPLIDSTAGNYDLVEIKARCPEVVVANYSNTNNTQSIDVGPHWRNVQSYALGNDELLVHITLQAEYINDLNKYTIHPAMLDSAVNAASQHVTEGLYLPFSYKSFKLYHQMPANFYSHIKKREKQAPGLETIAFDITLMDTDGQAFIQIEDYKVKRVRSQELQVNETDLYHQIHWKEDKQQKAELNLHDQIILLFKDSYGIADKLQERLRARGAQVILVSIGQEYQELGDNYTVTPEEIDYERLLNSVQKRGIQQIIHLSSFGMGESLKTQPKTLDKLNQDLKKGLYSLFYLSRALIKTQYKDEMDLFLISDHVYPVTREEKTIQPQNAALFGLAKVLVNEMTNLHIYALDLDDDDPVEMILSEMGSTERKHQVAYRQGKRYIEEFKKLELSSLPDHEIHLSTEGVYLITGGLGALGLAVARHLATQKKINLALIGRTMLPSQQEWEKILGKIESEVAPSGVHLTKLQEQLRALIDLRRLAHEVTYIAADIADYKAMYTAIDELRAQYGRINGIIHCAGVAGDGFIFRKDEEVFNTVLNPKVQGTWIIDQLTRIDRPDFFILFSSINAHYGRAGQGDYTAANAYLDSFAAQRSSEGLRTISLNWSAWKEIGMAVEYGVNHDHGIFKSLPTELGVQALSEVMQKDVTQLTIGELNYDLLLDLEGQIPFAFSSELRTQTSRRRKQNPQLTIKKETPTQIVLTGSSDFNDLEKIIAQIWANVLGLEEVDIYANFYDLGGDSILATYILKEMQKEFPGQIDISDIFTYSSVSQMAEYLQNKLQAEPVEKLQVKEEENIDESIELILNQLLNDQIESGAAEELLMNKLGGNQ